MWVRDGRIVPNISFSLLVGMMSSAQLLDDIPEIFFPSLLGKKLP